MQKSDIQNLISKRDALSREEVRSKSEQVCQRFISFAQKSWKPEDFKEKVITLYAPLGGELDPSSLIYAPVFSQAYFAYPRIKSLADRTMEFVIASHETDFAIGTYSILEPRAELPAVKLKDIHLMVVPGVVFGSEGERKGRGAGFYDRFLAQVPQALRVALAYDFQLLSDPIELKPWDIKMDGVFTETQEVLANLK